MTFKNKTQRQRLGTNAEQYALQYLQKQGLKLIEQNFRCRCGEIDLILNHDGTIVFVEVRSRHGQSTAATLETIDHFKQEKIIKTAEYFLYRKKWLDLYPCRFDVITIEEKSGRMDDILWIQDAFAT